MRILSFLSTKLKDFSNFPARYVERSKEQIYWRTPRGKPQYLPKTIERKKFRFTTNRPWTGQSRQQNMPGTIRKKIFLEPKEDWMYFRGDRVEILVGKDKGKQGIVTQVIPERNWVIVDGLNWHYRRVANDKNFPGIVIKSESPLLIDDHVKLVDPSDLQHTTVEWRCTEEGERVRVSTRTGRIIPVPTTNDETHDYKTRAAYIERDKDTTAQAVSEVTFQPELQTFEMDIMRSMGIDETRTPKKTFWY